MQTTDQVAGEAREKLAKALGYFRPHPTSHGAIMLTPEKMREHLAVIEAALRAQPERGVEEWNYDMSAAPVGPDNSVLITVPSLFEGCPPFVGEAWYCTVEAGEGWWWSGSGPTIYHASPISETNAEPIAWRHLPEPAAIRSLPLHPDKDDGGGR